MGIEARRGAWEAESRGRERASEAGTEGFERGEDAVGRSSVGRKR